MSHLLPSEKLEEQLPKLLPGVVALYRKHAEAFHVSKVCSCMLCLCRALSTGPSPPGSDGRKGGSEGAAGLRVGWGPRPSVLSLPLLSKFLTWR